MAVLFTNNATSTLASGIIAGSTAITLAPGTGGLFPSPTGSDIFYVTLVDTSNNIEIVKVTARTGDILTVVRGQEGTTARSFASGSKVENRLTAAALASLADVTSVNNSLAAINTALAAKVATATLAAATGATLVGMAKGGTLKDAIGYITPEMYGAKGDDSTDDTTSLQAALTACAATGGVVVLTPGKTYRYTNLSVTAPLVPIVISGYGATLKRTSTTGDGIQIKGSGNTSGPAGNRNRGSVVEGVRFVQLNTPTSGATVSFQYAEHFRLRDLVFDGSYGSIKISDCFDPSIMSVYSRTSVLYDILLEGTGTSPSTVDVLLANVVGEGTAGNTSKRGLIIDSGVSGVYAVNCDFAQGQYGVLTQLSYTALPEFLFFSNVSCDTTSSHCWYMGNGKAYFYDNCWAASSASGSGWELASGTGHHLSNAQAYNNGLHGVNNSGASEMHIHGGIFSKNSAASSNVAHGINVAAGISGFSIRGARCGNITGLGGSGSQAYGIAVAAGVGNNYSIMHNDVRGNGVGAISDGGTATPKLVMHNTGYNPVGNLTTPGLPGSGVAYTNSFGQDATVYISGGTVSQVAIAGVSGSFVATGTTSGVVHVPANAQIKLTYSSAPSWVWFGS